MMESFPKRMIICGSGNSVPFDNDTGLDNKLVDILHSEYSIGLNYWYKFGCKTTFTCWCDSAFYERHLQELKDLPLLIGKDDAAFTRKNNPIAKQDNTYLIKPSGRYRGRESWIKGFYGSHLVGMFAITLAVALGFTDIYLLGYDCCEIDGKTHFYQDLITKDMITAGIGKHTILKIVKYRTGTYNNVKTLNEQWYAPFKQAMETVNIYNVSEASMIETFPKISYHEFYEIMKQEEHKVVQSRAREKIIEIVENNLHVKEDEKTN